MSRILINDETGPVLLDNLIHASSLLARMRGLLGRKGLKEGTGMLLAPCRSIHMWFMRFPIDAAFLNQEMQVLKVVHNLKPWHLAFAPLKTISVLETANGGLSTLEVGMTLCVLAAES